ncbi:MAG TPA: aldo/keto reductase [Lachnospiraceae bacterium]|nr:aldo/keto reductase [Lachnospiraceae bacterium]
MQFRKDKNNQDISILGYGCMRFTRKGNSVELDKAEKEVMEAIQNGVNYFDTAYVYPGIEVALGEILSRNKCRDQVNIATKLPQYLIKSTDRIEKYFQEELKRLQTDYIDYYLMHMLTDIAAWEKLCRLGIKEWIVEKKEKGQIRNLGFSFHGNTEMFLQILNAYDWDFCQIQYNYMDEYSQAGRKGLEEAGKKGIPVIIMEPLRGGKLVDMLPDGAKQLIANYKKKRTAAEWAFRWLWDQPQVTCVLSGMNSIEMVRENLKIADEVKVGEFTEEDQQFIHQLKDKISANTKVGCTACGYCQPCPVGVDIPAAFRCYNVMYLENKKSGRFEYMQLTVSNKQSCNASLCKECGMCEKQCPQHIEIRKELKNAARELETPIYKIFRKIVQIFKLW